MYLYAHAVLYFVDFNTDMSIDRSSRPSLIFAMPLQSKPHSHRLSIHQKEAKLLFNKTLAGCYQQGIGEYKNVEALLLMWEDDDLGCSKEVSSRRGRGRQLISCG
jgi:hypothetical protein